MLLVRTDGATFVTDGRYRDQSADQLAAAGVAADIVVGLTQAEQRDALAAAAAGVGRLGLEADGVTWAQQRTFVGLVPRGRARRHRGRGRRPAHGEGAR